MQESLAEAPEKHVMDAEERHWTEDSELIERFVLNRLDPDERNELEDHLRVCEICKQAVRAEQILIAGIRRSGRERFKVELRRKLAAREPTQVPWPHILSAVAVVIILVSVAFYNRWFDIIKPSETEIPIAEPETAEPIAPREDTRAQTPEQSAPSPTITPQQQSQRPEPSVAKLDKTGEMRARISVPGKKATSPAQLAQTRKAETDQTQRESAALASIGPQDLWLEGELIEQTPDALHAPAEQTPAPARSVHTVPFVLEQQRLDQLPSSLRSSMVREQRTTVPARLQQRGDTLYLTVYFETLLDAATLRQTIVETPTADSLVVLLPEGRIIYRLPAEWHKK